MDEIGIHRVAAECRTPKESARGEEGESKRGSRILRVGVGELLTPLLGDRLSVPLQLSRELCLPDVQPPALNRDTLHLLSFLLWHPPHQCAPERPGSFLRNLPPLESNQPAA